MKRDKPKFRIGAAYKDLFGSGIFYYNEDGSVSYGPNKSNVVRTEPQARRIAQKLNRRNKPGDSEWLVIPSN